MEIHIKTPSEIEHMRVACKNPCDTPKMVEGKTPAGMATKTIEKIVRGHLHSCNAKCSFKHYQGYPANACVSINEEIVHGIPSASRRIEEGDIVSVDVGAYIKGFHGDAARTFCIGQVSEEKKRLVRVTEESFFEGIKDIKAGSFVCDISCKVQAHAESNGYSVVRMLEGHGVGRNLHEPPSVPNYGRAGTGAKIYAGMTIAIEPMINMGKKEIVMLDDDWTIVTKDGLPASHYENTILITENGVEILTL